MGEVIGALNGDLWKPTSCDYLELLFILSKVSEFTGLFLVVCYENFCLRYTMGGLFELCAFFVIFRATMLGYNFLTWTYV